MDEENEQDLQDDVDAAVDDVLSRSVQEEAAEFVPQHYQIPATSFLLGN